MSEMPLPPNPLELTEAEISQIELDYKSTILEYLCAVEAPSILERGVQKTVGNFYIEFNSFEETFNPLKATDESQLSKVSKILIQDTSACDEDKIIVEVVDDQASVFEDGIIFMSEYDGQSKPNFFVENRASIELLLNALDIHSSLNQEDFDILQAFSNFFRLAKYDGAGRLVESSGQKRLHELFESYLNLQEDEYALYSQEAFTSIGDDSQSRIMVRRQSLANLEMTADPQMYSFEGFPYFTTNFQNQEFFQAINITDPELTLIHTEGPFGETELEVFPDSPADLQIQKCIAMKDHTQILREIIERRSI